MRRPDWVPEAAWPRLEAALRRQPPLAAEVLADLTALVAAWDDAGRARLVARFSSHAERGIPLPAAVMFCISDLLEDPDG
jgi:hypothetical protein